MGKVKFIRKNGKVIPIREKGGGGGKPTRKGGGDAAHRASLIEEKYADGAGPHKKKAQRLGYVAAASLTAGALFRSPGLKAFGNGALTAGAAALIVSAYHTRKARKTGAKLQARAMKKEFGTTGF